MKHPKIHTPTTAVLKNFRGGKSRGGFSLIELLVSVTLLVFLLMTATTMFMTFLVSNAKTSVRHTIKGEGNFVISQLEYMIRNGESVTVTNCSAGGASNNSITIKPFDDVNQKTISLQDDKIRLSYGATNEFLTSDSTVASGLSFTCFGTLTGSRRIEAKFTLQKSVDSIQATASEITEDFRTVVQIRN